ncbi:MAG TPA: MBL fold metallo-hydrolase, partial [Gammaproteobacteria bacterium]|nr:MBL fold metallo-hydrolase [Gammaproteobacteria bacterium]
RRIGRGIMNVRFYAPVALAAGLLAQAALAQNQAQDFSTVEIKVHKVADRIYYLEGRGGNVGLSIGDDGVVMVDDQFAPLSEKIVAAIRTLSNGEIRFLVNTHVHGDHTGGNENFGKMGVPIIAQENVRMRLAMGSPPNNAAAPAAALPILTYADGVTLHLNGEDIRVVKLPAAHTDGDSMIEFMGSNVIHVGDVFRTTGYPVIDVNNGGSAKGTLEALAKVIEAAGPDTKLIPGHGEVSSREDVRAFRDMVQQVYDRVSGMIKQGMTLEQVVAAKPTAQFDAKWGDPARFLQGLYQSIEKET